MKHLRLAASIILLIAIAIFSAQLISSSIKNQKHKKNYAELHHFKYGIFSADAWKKQLVVIITDEIDKFNLTSGNKETLRTQLETQLGILIDKVFERIEKNNKDSRLKQSIMDQFIDVKDIKKGIPDYAQAIMAEMGSSKSESQIKGMLKEKVDLYMKNTFDVKDKSKKAKIIAKSGAPTEQAAKDTIQSLVHRFHKEIVQKAQLIVGFAILIFILLCFIKGPLPASYFYVLILTLLILLTVGVATPMIDMEAKIAQLHFMIFDHPVIFEDQILYFQSKSILDVFWIMITHKQLQMKFVGVLLVCFSIVFPVMKTISAFAYFYSERARKSGVVRFFVEQSGKWSMADVMVVAMFMAYIGFNGVVSTQLGHLANFSPNMELITTNGTSLQPGYYIFLAYTLLAMILSQMLKRKT